MAFEVWLQFAQGVLAANAALRPQNRDPWDERADEGMPMKPPEQLPVVLQVLLSQVCFVCHCSVCCSFVFALTSLAVFCGLLLDGSCPVPAPRPVSA